MLTQDMKIIKRLAEGGFGETTLVERDGDRYVLKRLKKSEIASNSIAKAHALASCLGQG